MAGVDKIQLTGTLLVKEDDALRNRIDLGFTTSTPTEFASGSINLASNAGGSSTISFANMTNPLVLQMKSLKTVLAYLNSGATTVQTIRVDGVAVIQLPSDNSVTNIEVQHVGATGAHQLDWFVGAKG